MNAIDRPPNELAPLREQVLLAERLDVGDPPGAQARRDELLRLLADAALEVSNRAMLFVRPPTRALGR